MGEFFRGNESMECMYNEESNHVICNGTLYDPPKEHVAPGSSVFWAFLCTYIFLVLVCGVMQGLVLAICSLDLTSLKVISQAGTEKTRKYALRMIPLAKRHHMILVTLIVANATAATAMPIFMERITNPITAVVISATAFLIFGEILPQSICSRYGLPIGYYMSWLMWILSGCFFVIAYPFSLLLDWMLGKESGTFYKRTELSALVDMHGPVIQMPEEIISCGPRRKTVDVDLERLSADEVMVIKGALAMGKKSATDVMVKVDDVYMLPSDAVLDDSLLHEIFNVGHSRIPVYEGDRTNVIGVFLTKRLIMVDRTQALPISSVFPGPDAVRALHPPFLVDEMTPLYDLLNQFQTGTCTHMAFVTKMFTKVTTKVTKNSTITTTTQTNKIVGIITLEDLIEELLQEEIRDESDLQRQWRLQVAKVKVVHRLTKGMVTQQHLLNTNQENTRPLVRFLSVPSLLTLDDDDAPVNERKNSMSYIS